MLTHEQVEQRNFRSSILRMIRSEEDSIANCHKLQELVKKDANLLVYRIIQPSKKNPNIGDQLGKQLEVANAQINKGVNVSRDILIIMVLAAFAIEHGKGKFFEAIIAMYPKTICLSKDIYGINIDTPLRRAIYSNNPALVSTVLSNPYFIDNEYNNTEDHKLHIYGCRRIAIKHCTEQSGILSMLDHVLLFRIPLISAMKSELQGEANSVARVLTSLEFMTHKCLNPIAYKSIFDECMECAKRLCNIRIMGELTVNDQYR